MININRFISKYSRAVAEGYAAVLAGSGLSRESGYVNWKELMQEFALAIDLDIDKEHDLVEVAQFFCNSNGGRGALNDEIYRKFTMKAQYNESLRQLSMLPINTFWTTNYDQLLETSLRDSGKKVDIKISPESLAIPKPDSDAVVYKMHGDCDNPSKCVLTKDDYEAYNIHRQLFTTALQGDLISKTFLFIGFSFDDPNLKYILSRIRILLGENRREHFFFTKKNCKNDYVSEEEYIYAETRKKLQQQDMLRYGIHAVEVSSYSEIPSILARIGRCVNNRKIFVAGSCRNYADWEEKNAYKFMYLLGHKLIENGLSLHTGLIEGVGPQVANGALTAINENHLPIDRYLRITTLPLIRGKAEYMNKYAKKMFQNNMIAEVGIVIFLFGNQYYDGVLSSSKGVMDDFQRAIELDKYVIPIGSTGFAAKDIMCILENDKERYPYLHPYWKDLNNERDPNRLSDLIIKIIKDIIQLV